VSSDPLSLPLRVDDEQRSIGALEEQVGREAEDQPSSSASLSLDRTSASEEDTRGAEHLVERGVAHALVVIAEEALVTSRH